jgi:hypothetical protein
MPEPSATVELDPMALLFDGLYLGKPKNFLRTLSRAKSWDVMHEVFRRARSFKAPKPFTVASFHALPRATATTYIRIARMASLTDAEVEMVIAYLHAQNPDHVFPCAILDPRHRIAPEDWP